MLYFLLFICLLAWVWHLEVTGSSPDRLGEALRSVLGHLQEPGELQPFGSLRIRCADQVACANPVGVKARNIVVHNGVIHVDSNTTAMRSLMEQLGQQNGARPSHLPSAQVQLSTKQMWVAGPRVNISSSLNRRCDWANAPNTHAVFLFPWETNNGFHTFNDNVLSILSNIVLQYITSPKVSAKDTPRYILYEFNAVGRKYEGATSMLYDLLKVIFGWEYVRPVRELLRGGPHCVRQLSWASATKPIYRDTLVDLRRATSDVLAHILHAYKVEADHNATVANSIASSSSSTLQRTTKTVKSSIVRTPGQIVRTPGLIVRTPRVVIVTRNESVDPLRKLHPESEYSMMRGFQRQGYAVEVCCNFTAVNTIALLLEHFQDVDICVGIHGAGLTNCAFARPGVVVVELQVFHAYGVQSFPKIAHMAGGDYVVHDLRGLRKVPGRSMYGIVLPEQTVQNVVDSAVRTYELRHPMVTALCAGTERSGAAAVPVLGGSSSGRAALQDAAPPSTLLGRWSTLMGKTAVQALLSNRTTETPPSLETAVQTHCKHTAPVGTSIAYTQPWRTLLQNAHVLVVVPKLKHIYIHPKDQPSPVTFDAHTLALSGFPGHSFHHIEAHLRSGEGQLHRTEHLAKFLKKPVRNYVARNNGTYWIVPNPSDAPYTKESILGPPLSRRHEACKQLPYFQLKQLAMPPDEKATQQCDPDPPVRKRQHNNGGDVQIPKEFIKYDGVESLLVKWAGSGSTVQRSTLPVLSLVLTPLPLL